MKREKSSARIGLIMLGVGVIMFVCGVVTGLMIDTTDEGLKPYLEAREKLKENHLNNTDISDDILNQGSIEGMLNVINDKYASFKEAPVVPEVDSETEPAPQKDEEAEPIITVVPAKIDKGHPVAIISIDHFSHESVVSEFELAIEQVEKIKAKGIILDLRGNLGGKLPFVSSIAGFWIGQRTVCLLEGPSGKKDYTSDKDARLDKIPTVVLIDGHTASAAEVLTGALRDYDKAHVIGEQSFGKGIGQDTFVLPDGSKVTFTTFYWKTPNGYSIHKKGIRPDQEVESVSDYDDYLDDDDDDDDDDGEFDPDAGLDEDEPLKRAFDYLSVTIS